MTPSTYLVQSGLKLTPVVQVALVRSFDAWLPAFQHLPPPVRFRASGALRAWQAVFDALPETRHARTALADPSVSPHVARELLVQALAPHGSVPANYQEVLGQLLQVVLYMSNDMLAFWLRHNAIFEPTLPLGGLLGGTDLSRDLPISMLQPPGRALCIVPPLPQRHLCAGATAIMVFSHDASPDFKPAARTLTLQAMRPDLFIHRPAS